MVNETVLAGLKSGLARGESLKKAMMTLYNAGYKKEEIEEAARSINEGKLVSQSRRTKQAEAILKALTLALERGDSLKKAMMVLHGAGYKKEEIEKAAHSISSSSVDSKSKKKQAEQEKEKKLQQIINSKMLANFGESQSNLQKSKKEKKTKQLKSSKKPTKQIIQKEQISPKANQKVSSYEQPPKPEGKIIKIMLGFFLLFLIGIVITIFLFKEELLGFFNSLFN